MRYIRRLLALLLCALLCALPLGVSFTETATDGENVPEQCEVNANEEAQVEFSAVAQDQTPDGGAEEGAQSETEPTVSAPLPDELPTPAPEFPPVVAEPTAGSEGDVGSVDSTPEAEAPAGPGDAASDDSSNSGAGADSEEGAHPAIDYTRNAAHSPDFSRGYAELLGDAVAYAGADGDEAVCVLSEGVVYALKRAANGQIDRLEVAFEREGEPCALWIGAEQLRPMSPEQCARFCAQQASEGDCCFLDEAREIPLDRPACEAIGDEPETQAPEVTPSPVPEMRVPSAAFELGVGERVEIGARFTDGAVHAVSYSSFNAEIVGISASGEIVGKAVGETDILLTSEFGQELAVHVTVRRAPSEVTLSAPRKTLGVNEQLQLTASLPKGECSHLTYRVAGEATAIATVDENGLVTTFQPGSFSVKVSTFNGKTASVKLNVKAAPEAIALDREQLTLGVGQSGALNAALEPEGSAGAYSFRAEPEGIVRVDPSSGALEALAEGSASVVVETYNHRTASCAVTVLPAPEQITFDLESITIGVGERASVPVTMEEGSAAKLSYKSSDKKIATVGEKGTIKGVKAGKATITVTAHNGKTSTLSVRVKAAPSKVTLSAHHKTLGVGETLQLKSTLPSNTASHKRTYSSSDEAVLLVDEGGTITALAEGSASITVKTFNGKKATLKFSVRSAPETVTVTEALTLGKGEKYTFVASLIPEGSDGGKSFSIDDATVASIDPDSGVLKALAPGEAIVRVSTYNGRVAECRLSVKAAPKGISLQEKNFALSVGDAHQLLPPVLSDEDAASGVITYKSSDKGIARVSSTGLVTAVKPGKAKITVSTYNGKTASLTVTVKAAPKSISFAEQEHLLLIHDAFTPEVKFANKAVGSYALESSDPAIAAVEGASVRGVSGGQVTLTATSFNGKKAEMRVIVPFPPERVWMEPTTLALSEGDSAEMIARAPEGQGALMRFGIDDPSIASFESVNNQTIRIQAIAAGETTVRVTSDNGREAEARLRVLRAPTALRLAANRAQYCVDEGGFQLQWTYGSEDEGGSVRFESSDAAVASVSAGGYVSLHKAGTALITARTYNGHVATCELSVGQAPGRMYFEKDEYAVALGDSVRLEASFDQGCESYSLRSEDERVVAVSGELVCGLELGSARITATGSLSGQQASCIIRVVPAPEGIEFEQPEVELVIGRNSSMRLSAKVLPDGVGSVHYASTDPAVATVDASTGEVTAHDKGECEIIATTYDAKYSARCMLRVTYLLEGVKVGIDPGHQAKGNFEKERSSPNGGRLKNKVAAPSAGVAHVSEHIINLKISLKLRDALEKLGAEVYLTRETANVDISNQQRAKMMNKLGVDFVLRIHANSWISPNAQGLSIIRRASCAYSKQEVNGAKVMAAEKKLGNKIAQYFKKRTGCKWRGLGTSDDYTMNNWSKIPCLLVEVGFMTHPVEGMKIVKPAYQDKMVKGIIEGICAYEGLDLPTEW